MKGIYTLCNDMISAEEDRKKIAINVDKIAQDVMNIADIQSMDKAELAKRYIKAVAEVALYDNGYRSVVRGEGYFVNQELCKNHEYVARFLNNAKGTAEEKEQVVKIITQDFRSLPEYGQYRFDGDGRVIEEITRDGLIEKLKEDAS